MKRELAQHICPKADRDSNSKYPASHPEFWRNKRRACNYIGDEPMRASVHDVSLLTPPMPPAGFEPASPPYKGEVTTSPPPSKETGGGI